MGASSDQRLPGPGETLGSYRLVELLGEGGMGVVYRAVHVRLPRNAAIKILKPQLARSSEEVQRFFEEARAVNEVGHRNIVDIVDFVSELERDPPLVYMVMESLEGQDLAAYLRRNKPLPAAEALEIALPLLDALGAAHQVGIVHRDLKPENVFLHHSSEGRVIKLLDFGVAKAFGSRTSVRLTNPGITLGTPRYMAPEQVRSKPLDARTDIYAFGIMLYEMLAGEPPFASEDLTEVMVQQARETPSPLPRDEQRPHSVSLEAVVLRCLEKKPARRYQSAEEVREALSACPEAREATEPTPPPVRVSAAHDELSETARNRRRFIAGLVGGGVLALALAVIAIALLVGGERSPPAAGGGAVPDATITRRVTPRPQPRLAPDAAVAVLRRFSVVTVPSGALVELGGKELGKAPLEGVSVGTGKATLEIRLAGHRRHRQVLAAGQRPLRLRVELQRLTRRRGSGVLVVNTSLRGESFWANLYVDGRRAGQTPRRLKLSAGQHRLRVVREGRRRTVKVRVRAGKTRRISIKLD